MFAAYLVRRVFADGGLPPWCGAGRTRPVPCSWCCATGRARSGCSARPAAVDGGRKGGSPLRRRDRVRRERAEGRFAREARFDPDFGVVELETNGPSDISRSSRRTEIERFPRKGRAGCDRRVSPFASRGVGSSVRGRIRVLRARRSGMPSPQPAPPVRRAALTMERQSSTFSVTVEEGEPVEGEDVEPHRGLEHHHHAHRVGRRGLECLERHRQTLAAARVVGGDFEDRAARRFGRASASMS